MKAVKLLSINATMRSRFLQLQTMFPTPYPTSLQITTKLDGQTGTCEEIVRAGKPHIMIKISKGLTMDSALDALFHEFAHAMNWTTSDNDKTTSHGPRWGICVADIFTWYSDSFT